MRAESPAAGRAARGRLASAQVRGRWEETARREHDPERRRRLSQKAMLKQKDNGRLSFPQRKSGRRADPIVSGGMMLQELLSGRTFHGDPISASLEMCEPAAP